MADTFSDMAADSPVPVLYGTHRDNTSTVKFFLKLGGMPPNLLGSWRFFFLS